MNCDIFKVWPTCIILFFISGHLENSGAFAQTFTWPEIILTKYAEGFSQPTHIGHVDDGSGRLFVVEQCGKIKIIKSGVVQSTPFLDITEKVSCGGEQGLLSVAFPPDYSSKRYFYVNYTDISGDTVIARYRISGDADVADPGTEEVLLAIDQPFSNHNGGQLAFGPDGYLYIGMGDGGSGGDPYNNAQDPSSLLGKILRIDIESGSSPYAIPSDNPFVNTSGYRAEIWALGFRNPWRFSFDRETGNLFIADVGQDLYEEVNYQPSTSEGGENYGWRIMEGLHCYNPNPCNQTGLVLPVAEYDHSQGCSVTGGMVYRGKTYLDMQKIYFYGDYCSGTIWGLREESGSWQSELLLDTSYLISTFGEDEEGEIYLADHSSGVIYKIAEERTGNGDNCLVTVAYGTYRHPHVKTLQGFKNEYLLRYSFGKKLVAFYYRHSPEVAKFLRRHESLKTATRWFLTPIVYMIDYPVIPGIIIMLCFIVLLKKRFPTGRVSFCSQSP